MSARKLKASPFPMDPTTRRNAAIDFVISHETVYQPGHWGDLAYATWENVPGDGGGITKFGIDQRSHPELNIKELTLAEAREIYHRKYWNKTCDLLPDGYAEIFFDIRVNGGDAGTLLQRGLNKAGAALVEDGWVGRATLRAVDAIGRPGLIGFLQARQEYYNAICMRRSSQRKFYRGWINRNKDLTQYVGLAVADVYTPAADLVFTPWLA